MSILVSWLKVDPIPMHTMPLVASRSEKDPKYQIKDNCFSCQTFSFKEEISETTVSPALTMSYRKSMR
jgi:hypothetical protein